MLRSPAHLFDGGPFAVLWVLHNKPLRVLPALSGVGLSSDAVHGDRQGRVSLVRDAAETHRAWRPAQNG